MRGVSGKVVAPGTLAPIYAVAVTLFVLTDLHGNLGKSYQAYTDTTGHFRIDSLPPGRYLMRVKRIGYRPAQDTVQTVTDSGAVTTGVLATDNQILDECGLTFQTVRVPWWER